MTDDEITKIADQCGMYECHDNGRINGNTVLDFARAILAAQLAAPVAAQEPRKLTMSMFATVADLEAAKAAQKAQPAPAQGERKPKAWALVMPDGIRQLYLSQEACQCAIHTWPMSYGTAEIMPLYE
jgi:hypothetical protein